MQLPIYKDIDTYTCNCPLYVHETYIQIQHIHILQYIYFIGMYSEYNMYGMYDM